MDTKYSNDVNVQLLLALMKAHGVKKVITSPGVANIPVVASMQYDGGFEMYSSVDERSAAYIACGLAEESGEPVAITCTGATASRNYMPGMTEAYYRKLPILAITATKDIAGIGHNLPQLIDRRSLPNDIVKYSLHLPNIHTDGEKNEYTTLINEALLELRRNGGGPVHINITNSYSGKFEVEKLPVVSVIKRYYKEDEFPAMPKGRVAVFVAAHSKWSQELTTVVEEFCEKYNAVVLVEQDSNYRGKYSVYPNLLTAQREYAAKCCQLDLMIYIGHIYGTDYQHINPKEVWRVNEDGQVRDTFGHLTSVFEMSEISFFEKYNKNVNKTENTFIVEWNNELNKIKENLPELPFSNIWVAQQTLPKLPSNAIIHFGIQNSLRSWNYFGADAPITIQGYCNTGGFGIDGCISSLVGASLTNPDQIYFGVVGDLAFFYDMNVLGNRHIGKNIRLMVVNNGRGQQFRNPYTAGGRFGEDADIHIAAAHHYGDQSRNLLRHYAEDLGFKYLKAETKEEYLANVDEFVEPKITERPVLFELFPSTEQESEAVRILKNAVKSISSKLERKAKETIKTVLGKKTLEAIKKAID